MSGPALLRVRLAPSRALAAAVLGVHGLGAACILAILPGGAGAAAALLLLALGAAAAWDRALLRSRRAPRAIEIDATGAARCILASGEALEALPVGGTGVTRFWVALGLGAGYRRHFLVTADMLDPELFRRLRLWALWGRVPGVAPAQPQP